MGIFSLASYPYSMKLLWSPIVDSVYARSLGRRKSWILPMQTATGLVLLLGASAIQRLMDAADVWRLTALFFAFQVLAATQDIAVDGWALSLLRPCHVGYASTCQTLGMNTGYFASFTVFLALNHAAFCDRYVRASPWLSLLLPPSVLGAAGQPLVTLPGYMRAAGTLFLAVTLWLWLFKREGREGEEEGSTAAREQQAGGGGGGSSKRRRSVSGAVKTGGSSGSSSSTWMEIRDAYGQLWRVVRLPAVLWLGMLLLTYRLGLIAAESAFALKLIEKGVPKEAVAGLVLLQFPLELVAAVAAGSWTARSGPVTPFMVGLTGRLAAAAAAIALTWHFPNLAAVANATAAAASDGAAAAAAAVVVPPRYMLALTALSLLISLSGTLTFTALGTLFNKVSDPAMGGAYLTLLNTVANMGYTLPKTPLFYAMDALTSTACMPAAAGSVPVSPAAAEALARIACPKKVGGGGGGGGGSACNAAGGACVMVTDGFYAVSLASLVVGVFCVLAYARLLPWLVSLPLSSWRAHASGGGRSRQVSSST